MAPIDLIDENESDSPGSTITTNNPKLSSKNIEINNNNLNDDLSAQQHLIKDMIETNSNNFKKQQEPSSSMTSLNNHPNNNLLLIVNNKHISNELLNINIDNSDHNEKLDNKIINENNNNNENIIINNSNNSSNLDDYLEDMNENNISSSPSVSSSSLSPSSLISDNAAINTSKINDKLETINENNLNSFNVEDTSTPFSESLTPTPTNNNTQDKFLEFSNESSNYVSTTIPSVPLGPPPPPNTLALRSNLNNKSQVPATINSPSTTSTQQYIPISQTQQYYTNTPTTNYSQPGQIIYTPLTYHPLIAAHHHPHPHPAYTTYHHHHHHHQDQPPQTPSSSTIFVHVDVGHLFQLQLGDKIKEIVGPATVKIVSNDGSKPVPLQLATPAPGQLIQQIVDENGILTDLIISSQHPHPATTQQLVNSNVNTNSHNTNINSNTIHTYYPYQIQPAQQLTSPTQYNNTQPATTLLSQNYYQNNTSTSSYQTNNTTTNNNIFLNKLSPAQSPPNIHQQARSPVNFNNIEQNNQKSSATPTTQSLNSETEPGSTSTLNQHNQEQQQQQQSVSPSSSSCSSTSTSVSAASNANQSLNEQQLVQPNIVNYQNDLIVNDCNNHINHNFTSQSNRKYIKINSFYFNGNDLTNSQKSKQSINKLNRKFATKIYNNNNLENKKFINHPYSLGNNKVVYYNTTSYNNQANYNKLNKKLYYNNNNSINNNNMYDNSASTNSKTVSENNEILEESDDLNSQLNSNTKFFTNILSSIKEPLVCDIESRSVLVRLTPIELENYLNQHQNSNDDKNNNSTTPNLNDLIKIFENLNYTLELSSNESNQFNKVYTGDANEITLKDLRPNTKYYLRVFASLSQRCRGDYTQAVNFETLMCQPDVPQPPKLMGNKKKNELTLRWSNPSNDNGSKIIDFILEYQEINENQDEQPISLPESYQQIYKGPLKQFIVKKLKPSQCYAFRLACENSLGMSEFSKPVFIYTSGSVPNVPDAPNLIESTQTSLTLQWGPKRLNENDYELQMCSDNNQDNIYGFITVYNGSGLVYKVTELKRSCSYQFRLRAQNDEGVSGWCETKKFKTLSDRPRPPTKVKIVKLNSNFKITWDKPKDDGGDCILFYTIHLLDEQEESVIYEGQQNEYILLDSYIKKNLLPGRSYSLRVSCSNSIGASDMSELIQFVTPAVSPGKCEPPKINGKPKSSSIQLKWSYPEQDGGSVISNYEIMLMNKQDDDNNNNNMIYKFNNDLTAILNNLLPGRQYKVKLRAINKIGKSEWSDEMEFISGAGCPDAPQSLNIQPKSASFLLITWSEPSNNGAPILEYRLEWCQKTDNEFTQLYCGQQLKYELRGSSIQPATHYLFRVQAINSNGPSQFSSISECQSLASVPSSINTIKLEEIKSDSVKIIWKQPNCNGSPISHYNLDFSEYNNSQNTQYTIIYNQQNNCDYLIDMLQPDTLYKLRLQAANSSGVGQFSNIVKFKTKALPPMPPNLELVSSSYNSIKLKWSPLNNSTLDNQSISQDSQIVFNLEMLENEEFILIYKGPLTMYKVNKLQESSSYSFRISATNESGQGAWSSIVKFQTTKSPPIINKSPMISELTINSCLVEWQSAKLSSSNIESDLTDDQDKLEYCLQMSSSATSKNSKESDYKEIYRGSACFYRLINLEPNHEYNLRVCAIRVSHLNSNNKIYSPYSPHTTFTTLKQPKLLANNNNNSSSVSSNCNLNNNSKLSLNASSSNKLKNKNNSSTISSFFKRFMWPSFYLDLNEKSEKRARFNDNFLISSNSKNLKSQINNMKNLNNTNKKLADSSQLTSNNNSLMSNQTGDTKSQFQLTSDKLWALLFIIIFLTFCFILAFVVDYIYSSSINVSDLTSSSSSAPTESSEL